MRERHHGASGEHGSFNYENLWNCLNGDEAANTQKNEKIQYNRNANRDSHQDGWRKNKNIHNSATINSSGDNVKDQTLGKSVTHDIFNRYSSTSGQPQSKSNAFGVKE